MTNAQSSEFLVFAHRLADISCAILREAAAATPDVAVKADASYVTETDKAVETRLREEINKAYPAHGILGEEWGGERLDAEHVWVLDPIDGTAPFIAGIPVYGTLIGLAHGGAPYIGVIDQPATGDRWAGIAGQFAESRNGPVRTRACPDFSRAFVTCSNADFMNADEQARFARVRKEAQYVQYGGSCFAYGVLAAGRTDLAVDAGMDPFDIIAPAAVVLGAGGVISDWTGAPVTTAWRGRVIAAGDEAAWRTALEILAE